ncbi:MAG: FG-GAP repeat protein, partial [Bryobacteraceae bacterium]|nr:FG-GAP repeat protein [Bryobacteraceae bacterium]
MRLTIVGMAAIALTAATPEFRMHEIATGLRGGYQLVAADVNRDGKPDLIALAQGLGELAWYENPTWERHVLARGLDQPINVAVLEGAMVLAERFSSNPAKSEGRVHVLTPKADVREEWSRREIDRLSTSHRLRVMQIGKQQVVINAPLAAATAVPPEYRGAIPLVMYRAPEWKRELISETEQGVMHGIFVKGDRLFTANTLGIHEYRFVKGSWQRKEIHKGHQGAWPKSGASDVSVGKKITASIEPWHGNIVALYEKGARRVL